MALNKKDTEIIDRDSPRETSENTNLRSRSSRDGMDMFRVYGFETRSCLAQFELKASYIQLSVDQTYKIIQITNVMSQGVSWWPPGHHPCSFRSLHSSVKGPWLREPQSLISADYAAIEPRKLVIDQLKLDVYIYIYISHLKIYIYIYIYIYIHIW